MPWGTPATNPSPRAVAAERDAWRACAEQLAAASHQGHMHLPEMIETGPAGATYSAPNPKWHPCDLCAALRVFDALNDREAGA